MKQSIEPIDIPDGRKDLNSRIQRIENLWNKLCFVNWSFEAFETMRKQVLVLMEKCQAYGYEDLGQPALKFLSFLDEIISSRQIPEKDQRYKITRLVAAIKQSIIDIETNGGVDVSDPSPLQQVTDKIRRNNSLVYLVDDDVILAQYIAEEIIFNGYSVIQFNTLEEMFDKLADTPPSAIILDIVFPDSDMSGIEAIKMIEDKGGKGVPVCLMSGRTDISARIQAIRAGSHAYFTKPVDISLMLKKLDELVIEKTAAPYKVLLVTKNQLLSSRCIQIYSSEGMTVKVLEQPLAIIQEAREFEPDIILMDLVLEECTGVELANIIRQEDDLMSVPMLFNAAENEYKDLRKKMSYHGDDVISLPLDENVLASKTRCSIEFYRRLQNSMTALLEKRVENKVTPRKKFISDVEVAVISAVNEENKQALMWISLEHIEKLYSYADPIFSDSFDKKIANTIFSCLHEGDSFTRLTNNVFVILTEKRPEKDINLCAEEICRELSYLDIKVADESLELNCNIGVSYITEQVLSGKILLAEAENASYHAKLSEKQKIVYFRGNQFEESTENKNAFSIPKKEIEKALNEKSFSLVFQPIIGIGEKTHELYEVLLRMLSKEGDLLMPGDFLPIAEQHGRMQEIDRWVIENAISTLSNDFHARQWSNIFIKLSKHSLMDNLMLTWISNCLNGSKVKGGQRIFFELSEKMVVDNVHACKKFVEGIKSMGCGVVLDHFGSTQYTLLALEEIPFNFVKIQSISINEISTDMEVRDRYERLIRLATDKCEDVIVGAVEKPENLSMIWNWGVRYVQGYFIQPPNEGLVFDFDNSVNFN